MIKMISIQGFEGSFHQMAAEAYYGNNIQIVPCATFKEVIKFATRKESEAGIMAIENSIAGSILANYNLLQKSSLKITGEVYLQIRQYLLANNGVQLTDIKEVHSHPMALQQCFSFLDKFNWKLVESEDTALSAKYIHQHRTRHIAAIASKRAAQLYDLNILAPNIQSEKNNYTRFLVLQKETSAPEKINADKASVNFQTDHSKGSLAKVLVKIAEGGINLSKLQSAPIPGSDWKYSFHADMEFDSLEQFHVVLNNIKSLTQELRVLGIYKKGKTIS